MKPKLLLIIFTICLFSLQQSTASFDYIYLKDFPQNSPIKQIVHIKNETTAELIMLPNGPFDIISASAMIQRIDQLPPSLLAKIKEKNIRLIFFTGQLTDFSANRNLKGITPRGYASSAITWDQVPGAGGNRTVYVKIGASKKGNSHGSVNLELHELAHSLDKIVYEQIRKDPRFLLIWQKEVKQIFPNQMYFLTFPEEYFAETFAMFYASEKTNQQLRKMAPLTYKFIQTLK